MKPIYNHPASIENELRGETQEGMNIKTDRSKRETFAQFYYPEVGDGVRRLVVGLRDIDGDVPGIRIGYDYQRKGWRIEQEGNGKWTESAFLPAPHAKQDEG